MRNLALSTKPLSSGGAQTRRRWRAVAAMSCAFTALVVRGAASPVRSAPYDAQLLRLAEIIGAIHYLRELCGNEDGQTWRNHMQDILEAEGQTALRRAVLARRFNQGYRNYSRTYKSFTVTPKTALQRFIRDGESVTRELAAIGKPKTP